MKQFLVCSLSAFALVSAQPAALAISAGEAEDIIMRSCSGDGAAGGASACGAAVQRILDDIGVFDNRRAIGRAIARAARRVGVEDEVDGFLSNSGASGVLDGFDSELGTSHIGPGETRDFDDGGRSDTNDNDGGEGSPA